MDISHSESGDWLEIRLKGRFDASWADTVQHAFTAAIREGHHRLRVDMSGVTYISSIGIRGLLATFQELTRIQGCFEIVNPSAPVREVIDLAGLDELIMPSPAGKGARESGRRVTASGTEYEIFEQGVEPFVLEQVGSPRWLTEPPSDAVKRHFGNDAFAVGIGALGSSAADCQPRFGEFLAAGGVTAYQPTDGSPRPDFSSTQGDFVPEGCLLAGFFGRGEFAWLIRFEAERDVALSKIVAKALEITGAKTAAIAALTENCGLVGASLRQPPGSGPEADPLGFPQIRDWLSFTGDQAFRDTSSLMTGVVSASDGPFLHPMGTGLHGHFHAACFPYRPLQKGRIPLVDSVSSVYDAQSLQAVLHLVPDLRGFQGAGETEFIRGAVWIAPATPVQR